MFKEKVVIFSCREILSFPLVGNLSSLRDIGNNRKKDSGQTGMTKNGITIQDYEH